MNKRFSNKTNESNSVFICFLKIERRIKMARVNNLPDKFKFRSTVKGMDETIYTAIKAENSYVITWHFMGEDRDMVMSAENMAYHFNQNEYEFAW
jgi:hypothetical protein